MANNYEIRIKVEIIASEEEETSGIERVREGEYRSVISGSRAEESDRCEQVLLEVRYAAMREGLGEHLSQVTQKHVQEVAKSALDYEIKRYWVDGEVGRFEFDAYYVKEEAWVGGEKRGIYPLLGGREWYRTSGWKEIALEQGVVNESYRKAGEMLNRVRHQSVGTPVRSLCESAEREGIELAIQVEAKANEILQPQQFSVSGVP